MRCLTKGCSQFLVEPLQVLSNGDGGTFSLTCPKCETKYTLFLKEYAEALATKTLANCVDLRVLGQIIREHFDGGQLPSGYVMMAQTTDDLCVLRIGSREVGFDHTGEVKYARTRHTIPGAPGDRARARLLKQLRDSGEKTALAAIDEFEEAREAMRRHEDGADERFGAAMGKMLGLTMGMSHMPESEQDRMKRMTAIAKGAMAQAQAYRAWVSGNDTVPWDDFTEVQKATFIRHAVMVLEGATPEDVYQDTHSDEELWDKAEPSTKVWYSLFVAGVQLMAEAVGRL